MKNFWKYPMTVASSVLLLASCSKDDGNTQEGESYATTIEITDAPIDNANLKAVFITVADVKVDGQSIEGFNKTTFDLSALVNGKTKELGNIDLAARTYTNLQLVLDYETDAAGNSPGCYVETANGEKDKIESSAKSIDIKNSFEVFAKNANRVVIDFDLRKAIKEEQGTTSENFELVSKAELSAAIRTVNEESTGEINGSINDSKSASDKIVVYAYEKGKFDAETETKGQGESNILFANAVTSSEAEGINNAYSLHFLSEGEYELVFVSYKKDGSDFYFNSQLEVESSTGLNLGALQVTSALQLSANVTVIGNIQ